MSDRPVPLKRSYHPVFVWTLVFLLLVSVIVSGGYLYLSHKIERTNMVVSPGVTRIVWTDGLGTPVMGDEGYSMDEEIVTKDGIEKRFLDESGNLINSHEGYAIERIRRWKEGDWEYKERRYFDRHGNPVETSPGFLLGIISTDNPTWGVLCREGKEDGRHIKETTFLGRDGRPFCREEEGYAMMRVLSTRNHDEETEITSYFDAQGRPCLKKGQYHEERKKSFSGEDGDGITEDTERTSYFGVDGEPRLSGEGRFHLKTRCSKSIERKGYSMTEEAVYGVDGEPVRGLGFFDDKIRVAKCIKRQMDKHAPLEFLFFDEKGAACPGFFGSEKTVFLKKNGKNVQDILHFRADDQLMDSVVAGVAIERVEWDAQGRILKMSYFDKEGKPAAFKGQTYGLKNEYFLFGGESTVFLGADGKPANITIKGQVFARIVKNYNKLYFFDKDDRMEFKNIILYDASGKLVKVIEKEDEMDEFLQLMFSL